jgi:diphthamide biosynthesis protein 2
VQEHSDDPTNDNDDHSTKELGDPEFSLVTGTLRSKKTFSDVNTKPSAEGGVRAGIQDMTLISGMYLASREFQGLEPRHGMDEPSQLEEGRSGIARGYQGQ